ncbi:MAG: uroporphyrinogen III synthase, partial [Betaproteobacteria bacterium HGW-Betaproteobacteria-21]
ALLLTSTEGARNLAAMVGVDGLALLSGLPVFASHARIAAQCRELGLGLVIETDAGDEGLLRALVQHFG